MGAVTSPATNRGHLGRLSTAVADVCDSTAPRVVGKALMSIMDKAKGLLGKNRDKAKAGVDKTADVIDDKTDGKHSDEIEDGAEKVKDVIDGLAADGATDKPAE